MSFRYKSTFASSVTRISGEELDKYVSLAGLEQLKQLMPKDIDLGENPDLIGIVLNAAVAGRANLNDDAITIETGVKIASKFIRKYCNSNHTRTRVIGVIVNAGFSEFGNSKILTKEEAEKSKSPINISLAVILWKSVLNEDFIDLIEESANPTSVDYGRLSASWELFFNNYDIYVGDKNISEASRVEEKDKEKFDGILKCNGGSGKTSDGKRVYRVIKADDDEDWLIPAGIGLVETPAAEVKGLEVVTGQDIKDEKNILASIFIKANSLFVDFLQQNQLNFESAISLVKKCEVKENDTINDFIGKMQDILVKEKKENLSLSSEKTVTPSELTIKGMKITKLAEITDETLKSCVATDVTSFFEDELKKANEKFVAEQKESEAAKTKLIEVQKELEGVKEQLNKIALEAKAKQEKELFDGRMAFMDETYDLVDEDRKILVAQIQKITSEEEWGNYVKQAEILMKEKSKAYKIEAEKAKKEKESKANLQQSNANVNDTQGVVDDALKNGQPANQPPPNVAKPDDDFMTQYAEAFKVDEMIEVKTR
jgi:hypothetical protein